MFAVEKKNDTAPSIGMKHFQMSENYFLYWIIFPREWTEREIFIQLKLVAHITAVTPNTSNSAQYYSNEEFYWAWKWLSFAIQTILISMQSTMAS